MHEKNENHSAILLDKAGLISLTILVVSLLVLLILRQYPGLDHAISDLFFTIKDCPPDGAADRCGLFAYSEDGFWLDLRKIGLRVPVYLMGGCVGYLAWLLMFPRTKTLQNLMVPFVALGSAIIGPGIIANLVLKEFWGRPRPLATVDFGGEFPFVKPGDIVSYCDTNCSFVSGEATAAFWMVGLALFFSKRFRWPAAVLLAVAAACISLLRVAFGKHFFSDITMGALLALFSIVLMCWIVQTETVQRWLRRLLGFSNRNAFGWFGSTQSGQKT